MQNVLIQAQDGHKIKLLHIGAGGSVTGTNLTFRNGHGNFGGCVLSSSSGVSSSFSSSSTIGNTTATGNHANFNCTDCIFDRCSAGIGGGVYSGGNLYGPGGSFDTLTLVRPTFTDDTCGRTGVSHIETPCGSGCFCDGNASQCMGCTCNTSVFLLNTQQTGFYCNATPGRRCPSQESAELAMACRGTRRSSVGNCLVCVATFMRQFSTQCRGIADQFCAAT